VPSKLLVPGSSRRTFNIDKHVGGAIAGFLPDGRQIVNRAQDEALNYKNVYGNPIPGKILCDRLGSYVHLYNLYWYARPYGATIVLATMDETGPGLYMVEASGVAHKYFGTAVGKGRQAAKTEIEKLDLKQITCREALLEIAKILYRVRQLVMWTHLSGCRFMMRRGASRLNWNSAGSRKRRTGFTPKFRKK